MKILGRIIAAALLLWALACGLRLVGVLRVSWIYLASPLILVFAFVMWALNVLARMMRWFSL